MICDNFKEVIIESNWCFESNRNGKKTIPGNDINILTILFQLQKNIFSLYSESFSANGSEYYGV